MATADQPDEDPSGSVLQVSSEQQDAVSVLDVAGEIDQLSVPELERAIAAALQQRPRLLVLDISKVEFLASVGLSLLVSAHQQAAEHTRLRVVAHGNATLRPIQLMGIDDQVAVYSSRAEALA